MANSLLHNEHMMNYLEIVKRITVKNAEQQQQKRPQQQQPATQQQQQQSGGSDMMAAQERKLLENLLQAASMTANGYLEKLLAESFTVKELSTLSDIELQFVHNCTQIPSHHLHRLREKAIMMISSSSSDGACETGAT